MRRCAAPLASISVASRLLSKPVSNSESRGDSDFSTMGGGLNKWAEYGLPGGDTYYIFKDNFVTCYDARTRNPKWVMERISRATVKGGADRAKLDFYEEPAVDARFRNRKMDFNMSGYDRGHLAPAANHQNSLAAMKDTFSLTNISPQVGNGFNRDYWARLEKFVRDLTRPCDVVYVVTGPLYMPRRRLSTDASTQASNTNAKWVMNHELLGNAPDLVAVPTHFFKVVLAETPDKRRLLAAFVLPNQVIPPETPLTAFLVPIDSLERVAGLRFFAQYLNDERRAILDERVPELRELPGPAIAGLLTDGSEGEKGSKAVVKGVGRKKQAGVGVDVFLPEHLCDVLRCVLPPEKFWEKGNGKGGAPEKQQPQQQQKQLTIWGTPDEKPPQ